MQKTTIFGHLGQKGPFWTVFGQNDQNGENYQKSTWNIFLAPTSPNCSFRKKVMSGFREKALRTEERTYGRTDATPKDSRTSWSRDQNGSEIAILPQCAILTNLNMKKPALQWCVDQRKFTKVKICEIKMRYLQTSI